MPNRWSISNNCCSFNYKYNNKTYHYYTHYDKEHYYISNHYP